jgi:hypothetical protein
VYFQRRENIMIKNNWQERCEAAEEVIRQFMLLITKMKKEDKPDKTKLKEAEALWRELRK